MELNPRTFNSLHKLIYFGNVLVFFFKIKITVKNFLNNINICTHLSLRKLCNQPSKKIKSKHSNYQKQFQLQF